MTINQSLINKTLCHLTNQGERISFEIPAEPVNESCIWIIYVFHVVCSFIFLWDQCSLRKLVRFILSKSDFPLYLYFAFVSYVVAATVRYDEYLCLYFREAINKLVHLSLNFLLLLRAKFQVQFFQLPQNSLILLWLNLINNAALQLMIKRQNLLAKIQEI